MICAIIPVYNESTALLKSTLRHLLTFPDITKIVIAITKYDPQLINVEQLVSSEYSHSDRLKINVSSTAGRARQMNNGANSVNADILLFLHADTRLPQQADQLIMASGKNAWGRFDVRLDDNRWIYRLIAWFMNTRSRLTSICTGDQAIFVSRQLFNQLGGFPDQSLMEDIEFCKRAKQHCSPVNLDAKVMTSARRWQKSGAVKTILLMWWLRGSYACGVSPDRLSQMYKHIR